MKKFDKKNIEDILALTPVQEGMLFHYLENPDSNYYFEQLSLEISGEIDMAFFEKAWNRVVEAHEMLRTVFRWEKLESLTQIILKEHKCRVINHDLSGQDIGRVHAALEEIKRKDRQESFDLRQVPFRVILCKIAEAKWEVVISSHHILYDGWSNGIILGEFFKAYHRLTLGEQPVKPVLKTRFKEFIKWIQKRDKDKQENFWGKYLDGFDSQTRLPVKRRTGGREKGFESYSITLEAGINDRLDMFVKNNRVTVAAVFYTAWGMLLQKYSNSDDVVFGVTVSGRTTGVKGIESMVGLFINTLPLRVINHPNENVSGLVLEIDKALKELKEFGHTPLVEIRDYSSLDSGEALFNTIVAVENYPLDNRLLPEGGSFTVDSYSMVETPHYDLTVGILPFDEIEINFTWKQDIFEKESIENLACHFKRILRQIAEKPEQAISQIGILSREEKNRVLNDFNNIRVEYPKDKTIHRLFEEQVEKTPDNEAMVGPKGGEVARLTYRELNEKSNRIAGVLRSKGVMPGTVVAVSMERSIELISVILGILKAGGVFLPVDPGYPPDRTEFILADSNAGLMLTQEPIGDESQVETEVGPCDPAYIIYTSGSTGRPKGVMVEHGAVVNLLFALQDEYPFRETDTYLLKTSFVFDVVMTELFGWFPGGGRLAILERDFEKDPRAILEAVERYTVTHINFVPSMFNAFLEILEDVDIDRLDRLRYIFLAGEALLPEPVEKFRALNTGVELENIYGPTEGTVYSSKYSLSGWDRGESVPIGKPLPNVTLYILGGDGHLQPVGVPGELCISGTGIAMGYLNRPELTAEKFWPGGPDLDTPYYRTGDLARWLPDGNIEFLGRIDSQVKIRGFRIEPGEIENGLLKHPAIKEAVVLAWSDKVGDKTGEKFLAAYFVASKELPDSGLRDYLSDHLPGYMVPAFFVQLDKMPLTSTGKILRNALPSPGTKAGKEYIPPANKTEELLVGIWSDLLDREKESISVEDNFFHLGGHSLKATTLAARIHKLFDVNVPLEIIFKQPTARKLSQYISRAAAEGYVSIEKAPEQAYYPLSSAQKRLYLLQQMDGSGTAYNMPSAWILQGELDKRRLEQAAAGLIRRHEGLRTSFEVMDEEPVQGIHQETGFEIGYYEHDEHDDPAGINNIVEDFVRPFDLSQAPLLRMGLVKTGEDRHLLLVDMHHIVSDGMSATILIDDFSALYSGKELTGLNLQYKDYAQWQNRERQSAGILEQGEYWQKEFSGEIPVLGLPTDFARPAIQDFTGRGICFDINRETSAALKSLALESGATLYMVLLAVYNIFLSKISGQEDIVIGTPTAGRRHHDLEKIIGMFVNTLALRNYPSGGKTFTAFLAEVKEKTLKAFENQEYQYEDLVEQLSLERDTARNPLFDTMFALQNAGPLEIDVPGLKVTPYEYGGRVSKFDLTLEAVEGRETLQFRFEYAAKLFKQETVEGFVTHFKNILAVIPDNKSRSISELEIISPEEKKKILFDFNFRQTGFHKYPNNKTIPQLFGEQVAKSPDHFALVEGDGVKQRLTYRELSEQSDWLARILRAKGAVSGSLIGIMLERSNWMIIGILGIIKAGAAYVPLNPEAPTARNRYILEDCGSQLLVTTRSLYKETISIGETLFLDESKNLILEDLPPLPDPVIEPVQLCYVIFTSGSTGNPKGVPINHGSFSPLLHWGYERLGVTTSDRALQVLSYYFDYSVWEIFFTLTSGASLYTVAEDILLNPVECTRFIVENKITLLHITPSQYRYLADTGQKLGTLELLMIGAERIDHELMKQIFQSVNDRCRVFNLYGPTECTVISSALEISRDDFRDRKFAHLAGIPIGKPVANTDLLVLDNYLKMCPIGIPGELYISGDGLAPGYLGDPEKTANAFIPNPYASGGVRGQRLYKTGDLVRWLRWGDIEFLGRIDQQVKIRGLRIELGEIESHLLTHEKIKGAVVRALPDPQNPIEKCLCAYIVGIGEFTGTGSMAEDLKKYLAASLPDYMLPAYFVSIDSIPVNPNGKVDLKALPVPRVRSGERYAAPRDHVEAKLVEIWSQVLGRGNADESIGIHDNFFHLGGHSLRAAVLTAKIHKQLEVRVPLAQVFKTPHIEGLARYINSAAKKKYDSLEAVEKKQYYPLSSAQKRLFILQQMEPGSTGYNISAVMSLEGRVDREKIEDTFRRLIRRHESFRTFFEILDGTPVQKINDDVEFEIRHYASSPVEAVLGDFIRPFELSAAPLLRVGLIKEHEDKYILMVDMHHIIADGTSIGIMQKEILDLYLNIELTPLRIQYKDYASWQTGEENRAALRGQETYWLEQFAGELPVLNLPTDYSRPMLQTFEGNRAAFRLDSRETAPLINLAREQEVTLYMLLSAVFNTWLSKLSGEEDIVIGTPVAGRKQVEVQGIIGMFVNTLALRNYPGPDKRFIEFLKEVKERTLEAFQAREYQFEDLVEHVVSDRDTSRNPLFDVMFVFQNMDIPLVEIPGLTLETCEYENKTSKFDLNLEGMEKGGELHFNLEYSTNLFKPETIHRFIRYFKNIINVITRNPETRIAGIQVLDEEEKREILEISNGIAEPVDPGETVHGMFEKVVSENGEKTALVYGRDRMTYGRLNREAGRLAGLLRGKGIGSGGVVGLMVERSFEMVTGMLAIMKAGGAYLPIDPKLPGPRKQFMIEDSNMAALLVNSQLGNDSAYLPPGIEVIDISDLSQYPEPGEAISNINTGSDLVYVIFTSGSTGKPKGVMLEHTNLVNLIKFQHKFTNIDHSKVLQFTTISFDVSFQEIFSTLLSGGELYLIDEETRNSIPSLLEFIHLNQIRTLFLPMSFLKAVSGHDDYINALSPSVAHIVTAGEQVVVNDRFRRYLKENNVCLHNHYGPSETHVVTALTLDPTGDIPRFPSIGKPIGNTAIYILDKEKHLQPVGVAGELYAAGLQVGRGYLGREEETRDKFMEDIFTGKGRLYRTGDLGRWLADGNIEFLGRVDHQVKIRGIRVEPGEIESRLKAVQTVNDAVVVVKQFENGENFLCAYVVTDAPVSGLKPLLSEELPDHMIPSFFVPIGEIPLTPSGKVDRRALPEPEITPAEQYMAPRDELEKTMVKIWAEVLQSDPEQIGIDTNFFQAGGHSLKAIILISRIHKELDVKISLVEIFKRPSIRGLAQYISGLKQEQYISIAAASFKKYYELSSAQKRLYFLAKWNSGTTVYNLPAVLALEGEIDYRRFEDTFKKLIQRHESLRTSFEIIDGQPVQRVHENVCFAVQYFETSSEGETTALVRDFVRPFDLSEAPLIRVGLIKQDKDKHVLIVDMHHIVSDGVSVMIFKNDFIALYSGENLPPLRLQYKDFSEWQNSEKQDGAIKKQADYWLKELAGEIPVLNMPADYPRPAVQGFEGSTVFFKIDAHETRTLNRAASDAGVTPFALLTAIFKVLLSKICNQEEIIIGTAIAGRNHPDLEGVMGMFVNALVLRGFAEGDKTFLQFLEEVKQKILHAFENQDYQFEELVEKIDIDRDTSRNPVFDAVFALQNIMTGDNGDKELSAAGLQLKPYDYVAETTKFDLACVAVEEKEEIHFNIAYCTRLFKQETIRRMAEYFKRIILSVNELPHKRLFEIEVLSEAEKNRLLYDLNDTEAGYPRDKTIHRLFEEQVERTPENIAVSYEDETTGEHQNLTYRQLNDRANRLGRVLRGRGVGAGSVVGVLIERSPEMITGLLGILKAGGGYLPLHTGYSTSRIRYILDDAGASLLLTTGSQIREHSFTVLQNLDTLDSMPYVSAPRPQIKDFNALPIPDRSLIDYEKYNTFIGLAMVKHTVAIQGTRGCPYNCAYCHKIWPKSHVVRSAENIFAEVKLYYDMGVRRFVIVDDIFNLDKKNSARFFQMIIDNQLKIQIFFPNGVRGDILTKEYIDLLVQAGTTTIAFALETASPRLQKLIRKNVNLKKLRENIEYFCQKYPHVILELFAMHGFPTETEEEARMTMDFIKSIKWLHFPYFHILKIYPDTDMEKLAIENGVSAEAIADSENLAYHELPDTLPFEKSFTLQYQAEFLNGYFMSRERLLAVLPYQVKLLTGDEIVQKYDSYLPAEIHSFDDLLEFAGITPEELGPLEFLDERVMAAPGLNRKMRKHFTPAPPAKNALRVLLLDLSQFFSNDSHMLYDVVEPPLGLMNILTYLKQEFGSKIDGRIAKSRVDFDNYDQFKELLLEFKPDIIGVRSLTYYKDFLHRTTALIRQWGIRSPIVAGGPYATSDYLRILQDPNINLVVMGEGELTFNQLIGKVLENGFQWPAEEVLKEIPGIAFMPRPATAAKEISRGILMMDELPEESPRPVPGNLPHINQPQDLAYIIYTSGTTGKPKGMMIQHNNVVRLMTNSKFQFDFNPEDTWTLFHSYNFDFSVWEMYGALLYGGKLVIIPQTAAADTARFREILIDQQVTVLNQTPSAFYYLLNRELEDPGNRLAKLRYVIFGGEMLKPARLKEWRNRYPGVKLINMFGITETTVHVTYKEITQPEIDSGASNIGLPIPTLSCYVMDNRMSVLPPGVAGELYVGGDGVGRGYLNRPQLTSQRFLENPYKPGERLYRSGDLVKMSGNGEMEYLGRGDHQVKIRGFRIELGEIENQLLKHKDVKDAVVFAGEAREDQRYICAYFVATDAAKEIEISGIREYLLRSLPDYMVPAYFIQLERIPLNVNGKVDRKQLPDPKVKKREDAVALSGEMEEKLAGIWAAELGIQKEIFGLNSNFFDLGGHSLNATVVVSKIQRELDIKIPLSEFFVSPTIGGLAQYIRDNTRENLGKEFSAIEPGEKREYYPLSSAQKRVYVLQEMELSSVVYNIPEIARIEPPMDRGILEQAIRLLIQRHDGLRTRFFMLDGEPVQGIDDRVEFNIEYYTLNNPANNSNINSNINSNNLDNIINEFVRPFDLSRAPLLRVGLVTGLEAEQILLVDMHHIISDGVSHKILVNDFMALCRGEQLEPLKLQYKDYSLWLRRPRSAAALQRQKAWWKEQFEREIPVLNMPADYPRPPVQVFDGNTVSFQAGAGETASLNDIARSSGGTLFMVLLAVTKIFLSKISGQEDIVAGTPIAGRNHADLQHIIGMFVNTLALRSNPAPGKRFEDYLHEIKEITLKAFENQDYPFEELIEEVAVTRDISRNPLFDAMFILQNTEQQDSKDLNIKPIAYENKTSKLDLTVTAIETGDNLSFYFEYCTKLFKQETILRFIQYFKTVLSNVVQSPGAEIAHIGIISEEEKQRIMFDFNNTGTPFPDQKTITQLFEEQAARTPGNIAVTGFSRSNGEQCFKRLTYREFNEATDRLARLLRLKGVSQDAIAAILMERSVEMLVGIFAVLKAGGAYLPMDPAYPEERIDYLLADSHAKLLLCGADRVPAINGQTGILQVEPGLYENPRHDSADLPEFESQPSTSLAYVIYTSGSTGKPKGVMVEHRSVVNRLNWMQRACSIREDDVILQKTTYTFDVSVWELFWWSFQGASVHLLEHGAGGNPETIFETIKTHNITVMHFVPSMLNSFLEFIQAFHHGVQMPCLRLVFASGEALSPGQADTFNRLIHQTSGTRLINLYGPTEATVDVSYYNCPTGTVPASIPIGKPIDNTRLYIIDKSSRLQPVGIAGELCIAGAGLARGYLNRPGLTREKFADLSHEGLGRVYKTGDLTRWREDGNIEFLGRLDFQVKIRGFRIEPGEIENRLSGHPAVTAAAVLVKETGDEYLCAYYTTTGETQLSPDELKDYLSHRLPAYMIPTYFIQLDRMPLTPSGKIHRKALPAPGIEANDDYTPPRDPLEERLRQIWSNILAVPADTIGIDAKFFNAGGHSLRAATLVSRIYKEFNVKMPLTQVFLTPTIRGLADIIRKSGRQKYVFIPAAEEKEYYPMSDQQKGLYFVQTFNPGSISYNMPMAFVLEGRVRKDKIEKAVGGLIRRHESLRTSFKMVDTHPVQEIHDHVPFKLKYYEMEEEEAGKLIRGFAKPFDLGIAPLLRVCLVKADTGKHILVVDLHHIISDAFSQNILIRDFTALYLNKHHRLEPLKLRYKDYAQWHLNLRRAPEWNKQETYWLNRFRGELPQLKMTTDFPRPAEKDLTGERVDHKLDAALTRRVKEYLRQSGATLYMFMLAVYTVLLSKYSGQEDIVVGSPITGRVHPDLYNIMGLFVNMLPMRNNPAESLPFRDFLEEVKTNTLNAYENQDYQFTELVSKLDVPKDLSRHPLFDVVLALDNTEIGRIEEGDFRFDLYDYEFSDLKFDLLLDVREIEEGISLNLNYSVSLFKSANAKQIIRHIVEILEKVLGDDRILLKDIEISHTLMKAEPVSLDGELSAFGF